LRASKWRRGERRGDSVAHFLVRRLSRQRQSIVVVRPGRRQNNGGRRRGPPQGARSADRRTISRLSRRGLRAVVIRPAYWRSGNGGDAHGSIHRRCRCGRESRSREIGTRRLHSTQVAKDNIAGRLRRPQEQLDQQKQERENRNRNGDILADSRTRLLGFGHRLVPGSVLRQDSIRLAARAQ
jgi:hypothetical protein